MESIKEKSLEELEDHYRERLQHWTDRRLECLKEARKCEQKTELYEQKLRYVQALVSGTEVPVAAPPTAPVKRPGGKRRQRKSPIREATLQVLRDRPGEKLTVAQIRTAIRKDTHKRCSRQAINVNVDLLEEAGLIKRDRAPKGSGARFVFWAD